jgi:RimJ/RimL family protein N-acetyltransferase
VPFELQPVLTGELVELRPLRPDDHAALYAVSSDPLIWEQHPAKERAEVEGFRQFFDQAMDSGGAFLVIDRKTGDVIGSSRFFGYDEVANEVEIGWSFLARAYWGGRYNGEMKRLMLRHAFRFVNRVVFLIAPTNTRSQMAIQRIGAVRNGSRNVRGSEHYVFEITRQAMEAP